MENEHLAGQLTLEVGGEAPAAATLKISGKLVLERELRVDEPLRVIVVGPDGEQLAAEDGSVGAVGFKRKTTKDMSYVVREQTVKLSED